MHLPKKVLIILLLSVCTLPAQFKYSAGIGSGIFIPDFTEFNTVISDSGLSAISGFWMPLAYDFSIKIYPSLRVGYFRYSSALTAKIINGSSDNFSLDISMNGFSVQTFFSFFDRFEALFGLAPLLGSAEFTQDELTATTSPFQISTTTEAGMKHSFFAYYSWISVRYHLNHWLALEAAMGYLDAEIKGDSWKNGDQEIGINAGMKLSSPTGRFGVVFGW